MKLTAYLANERKPDERTFGRFMRQRREELGYGVRELAAMLHMSPAYLSDIEKGNRSAPLNYMPQLMDRLEIDENEKQLFEDLASASRDNRYEDINPYLTRMPNARMALRLARDHQIPAEEWSFFAEHISRNYGNHDVPLEESREVKRRE